MTGQLAGVGTHGEDKVTEMHERPKAKISKRKLLMNRMADTKFNLT